MQFATKFLAAFAAVASVVDALPIGAKTTSTTNLAKRSFNAGASNNVAAYWGNSDETNAAGLAQVCSSNYDIIILTFAGFANNVVTVAGGGDSASLSSTIKQCQSQGKKVMMSIGGANAALEFSSDSQAQSTADAIAKSFLQAGSGSYYGVALDGIDIDNETGNSAHWQAFVSQLRTHMDGNQYISGAPQCPFPDQSINLATLNLMDFVWVQFYNNAPCNHGSSGFAASVKQWSQALTKPKLYIGTPGSSTSAPSGGYIQPSALQQEMNDIKSLNLPNIGGYALWDASTAMVNNNYQGVIAQALEAIGSIIGGLLGGGSNNPGSAPAASSSAPAVTSVPAAVPTSVANPTPTSAQGHGQFTSSPVASAATGTVTVQATSTAVVTSTQFLPSSTAAAAAVPTSTVAAAPSGSSSSNSGSSAGSASGALSTQPCSNPGRVVCSDDGSLFGICDATSAVMMPVADGMICQNASVNGKTASSSS